MLHIKLKGLTQMKQHGSNYCARRPLPGAAVGVKKSKFIFFFKTWSYCISKENYECSNMIANILPAFPLILGIGSMGQYCLSFSEHGHDAYQIKGITKCSSMVENILPADPHPWLCYWGRKVKIKLFQNMVMLHI